MSELRNFGQKLSVIGMNSDFSQLIINPDNFTKCLIQFKRLGNEISGSERQINKSSVYILTRLSAFPNLTPCIPGLISYVDSKGLQSYVKKKR